MVILKSLASDPTAEREGVWCEYEPGFDMRIASTATAEFERALFEALKPYSELARAGKLTDEQRDGVLKEVFAQHAVKDWRGLESEPGTPLPFSPAEALALFKDPAYHRLWKWAQGIAGSEARFRAQRMESARKN